MYSIVCVFNNEDLLNKCLIKSIKYQKFTDYELILIDSKRHNFQSASSALNYAFELCTGDYVIFAHQDLIIEDKNFLQKLDLSLKKEDFGIAGVAGLKIGDNGKVELFSNILHGLEKQKIIPYVKRINKLTKVSTVDECFFVVKNNDIRFRNIGETWHLYATDYALQMEAIKESVVVLPLQLWHYSKGNSFNMNYFDAIYSLCKKNKDKKFITTFWGKWPTNIVLLKIKILYRKLRYRIARR